MRNGKAKKTIFSLLLAVVFCLAPVSGLFGCQKKTERTEIIIGVSESKKAAVTSLVNEFNSLVGAKAVLRVYKTEEEKNYYLSHGIDDCDVYVFDYASSANRYKERLAPLDRGGYTNRYMVSVINSLKSTDGHIYVIPSDGFYYTQCYNLDLLGGELTIPETMSEFKIFISRLKNRLGGEASSASLGGTDSVLFSLMSVAYPLFLNTVRGAEAIRKLADGSISILDDEYEADWNEVFVNLQVLYSEKFYSIADIDKTAKDGVVRFNEGNAFAIQNSGRVLDADISEDLNVKYAAFVGSEERDACFGSLPALCLAASKDMENDTDVYNAVSELFGFFAQPSTQKLMHETADWQYISYLKGGATELPPAYSELQSKVSEGRFFVLDSFYNVFNLCINEITSFLKGEYNLERTMRRIDERLEEEKHSIETALTVIDRTLAFDETVSHSQNTPLGEFLVNNLAKVNFVDGVIMPSSALKCSLLKGTLSETELGYVFEDVSVVYAQLSADDVLRIYNEISGICYPLINGLQVKNGNVYRANGKVVSASEKVYVLVPLVSYAEVRVSALAGTPVSSNKLLVEYFKSLSQR